MKSIIESVAEWLRTNPYLSAEPTTDALRCGVEAAGLFKAPESVREYSIDGTFSAAEHYLFTLRRESLTEQGRQESERLLEETVRWIGLQARAGNLPALSGGRTCWAISVDGTFSMPSETDTDQIWEMSLAVSYDDKLTTEKEE